MSFKTMKLLNGDCIVEMQQLIDEGVQVDSVVTDPPYELGFLGKSWDSTGIAFQKETWELALQLLKPGGHLLAFGGSRTYHRMAVAIEDAGFEIRDQIMWLYGSGFPKSLNIGKAVDKLQGNEREDLGYVEPFGRENRKARQAKGTGTVPFGGEEGIESKNHLTKGTSPYEGWGTALKPAHEPVVMARKPISEKTVAENVLKHGTGGINIDDCRIEGGERDARENNTSYGISRIGEENDIRGNKAIGKTSLGRFPANVMHDGSEVVVKEFPNTKSIKGKPRTATIKNQTRLNNSQEVFVNNEYEDEGSAARFFYCPKVSKKERNRGLDKNNHPTVKPIELMKYLCRLVTPKGGTILDPFMGSGSTGMAAKNEGFEFIGIEKEKEYFEIAEQRINTTSPLLEFIK
jgi:site-specific DNA-methyltransferase (adenine-specific)